MPFPLDRLRPFLGAVLFLFCSLAFGQSRPNDQQASEVREIKIAAEAFSRGDPVPAWVQPMDIPATTRRNPVVIRLADTQFRVGATHSVYVNRAIQVNDSSALARIGQYQINFVPQYQKLRLHKVAILREGRIMDHTPTVDVRFLQREVGLEQGIYSGGVTASLLLSDVRVGDTLHIAYSTEGTNPVFGNTFADGASWDQVEPIELRNVVLSYPASRAISWRMVGDYRSTRISPQASTANGYRTLRWQEQGIDGLDFEPYIPDGYFPHRVLEFSEYADWNAVARWADGLFPHAGPLPAELRQVVERLRALPTAEARASAALQWVQTEIRYFGVSLGESSHRPYPPAQVAQRRFGDCKDKTYLLVTLLKELGIEARPVLVSLFARRTPARFLPSPHAFDHVIVQIRIDGRTWYADGTRLGQQGRLSRMAPALEGAFGLPVGPDTDSLVELKTPNIRELNTIEVFEDFALPRFGSEGSLQNRMVWLGAAAEAVRLVRAQATPEQLDKFALSAYEMRYPGIVLDGKPSFEDDTEDNRLTMTARYKVPKLATDFNGDWVMKFFPANLRGVFNLPPQVNRNFPLAAAGHPYTARYHLAMDWPDSVAMIADPSTQRIGGDLFNLEVTRSFRGNRSRVDITFETRGDVVQAARMPGFMEDIQKLNTTLGGYVLVERSAIKERGLLGQSKLQDMIRKRLQTALERTTRTLEAGRLAGEDLAETYCQRAETLADMGRAAEGMKDAQEAVRIAPQLGRAWECRGNLYFATGEFAKAVPDYGKALTLGANEFTVLYRRGHARFYQGKLAEAAEDFGKAASLNKDEAERLYAELWQLWTLQRLKRSIPPELQTHATEAPHGPWPRPALAMLAGALTPEQMLNEVGRRQGDERELNEAEAYFYLGQHRLNQGQPQQAREAFEKTREKGITMYLEHVAAGFELGKLGTK